MPIQPTKKNVTDSTRDFRKHNSRIKYPDDSHHINVKRNIIDIEESKLELCARDYAESIKASKAWHTPLGILVTVIFTMLTAKFDSSEAQNIAWISLGASGLWLIYTIYLIYSAKKMKTASEAKEFVRNCKNFDYESDA